MTYKGLSPHCSQRLAVPGCSHLSSNQCLPVVCQRSEVRVDLIRKSANLLSVFFGWGGGYMYLSKKGFLGCFFSSKTLLKLRLNSCVFWPVPQLFFPITPKRLWLKILGNNREMRSQERGSFFLNLKLAWMCSSAMQCLDPDSCSSWSCSYPQQHRSAKPNEVD